MVYMFILSEYINFKFLNHIDMYICYYSYLNEPKFRKMIYEIISFRQKGQII